MTKAAQIQTVMKSEIQSEICTRKKNILLQREICHLTCVQNLIRTMYWFGVESRMIFICSMTSLNGAISFMRSWLVMVAGTVRMQTIALRLTSSVSDVILLQKDRKHRAIAKTGELLKQRINMAGGTHLVLYRCMMPWMISTEGLPLKKEMWSGSCLEGESGAAPVASLLS